MNASENFTGNSTDSRRGVSEATCFHSDPPVIKGLRICVYCIVIVISLIGNSMIVAVVYRNKSMWKTVNFFIVNMSVAELLVTVTYMPRIISLSYAGYGWQVHGTTGLVFCKIACFNEVAIFVSILTIVTISFDRFFAVVFPLQTFITVQIGTVLIVGIWISAIAAGFPEFYAIELRLYKGQIFCYLDLDFFFGAGSSKAYFKFIIIGAFVVPFSIISVLYSAIAMVLIKRRHGPGDASTVNDVQARLRDATRNKVLKMVSTIVLTFVLCWSLYFVHFIAYSYGVMLPCHVMFLRLFLAHFHCALSPFIYGFFNVNFRKGIVSLVSSSVRNPVFASVFSRRNQSVLPENNPPVNSPQAAVNPAQCDELEDET